MNRNTTLSIAAAALAFGAADLLYLNLVLAPALAGELPRSEPASLSSVSSGRVAARPPARTPPSTELSQSGKGFAAPPALAPIEFDRGSSVISSAGERVIDQAARAMHDDPRLKLRLRGHADASGTDRINQDLSWGRAKSVALALRIQGIESERIRIEGRGSGEPLSTDGSESALRRNRRTEFVWER